jgi:hypothetical protein
MGYHDTFLMFGIKKCPDSHSLGNCCNTGEPVPLTIEHFGPIKFRVKHHHPEEGEGGGRHRVMVGTFSVFRIKPFWKRWFIPRYESCCEKVDIRAYVDCYPDRDGSKGVLQLTIPEDLDQDEMLASPQRDQ